MYANYHSHTFRCNHASGTEREYVEAAIKAELSEIGFSDHSPYPFPGGYCSGFRMKCDMIDGYFKTLTDLKREYAGEIKIRIGLEAEYYPKFFPALIKMLEDYPCEYLIMGQHFIGNEIDEGAAYSGEETTDGNILGRYVDQVIEGMETGKYLYVAHPDLCRFTGDGKVYDEQYGRLCRRAKELGIPLEINMLGLAGRRHYPNEQFWKLAGEIGNTAIIGCDSHSPDTPLDTATYQAAVALAKRNGLDLVDRLTVKEHI